MPILSLIARLGLDKTGFDAGMSAAGKSVNRFGAGLKSQLAGAFGAAAVISYTKSIIALGSEIKDTMDRLGVGARDVQEFQLAAKLGGQSADTFAKAIEKIRLAMVAGVADGKNPLSLFGITMADLRSGDAVGILRKLSVELENFSGSADQLKALSDVFGARGVGGVINMLAELRAAGKNPFITNEEVELLDRAGDSATRLWNRFLVFGARFLTSPRGLGGFFGSRPEGDDSKMPVPTHGLEAQEEARIKATERLADIEAKTADQLERNRVAQMTDEERLNDLISERAELVRQLGFALTKEAEAAIQLKIAQNSGAIIGAQSKVDRAKKDKGFASIEESALGRIGAFTGAGAQASLSSPQIQQLDKLQKIHDALVRQGIIIKDVK